VTLLDWFHTSGSLVAFGTGAFTLYDRLLRHRPLLSIGAQLMGANAKPFLRVKNVAPYDIFVESISCKPAVLGITTATSVRAIAALMTGSDTTVLLSPNEETLLTVIRFDHEVRGVSETERIKITASWRRAETLWIKPRPAVLHTCLKDIADREGAVISAGRRA
jgi:hypothetical protein